MSIIDYTNNANELILGVRDAAGSDHYLKFGLGTTTDIVQALTIEGGILLLPGEKPIGVILTPGSSDVCYFSAHGGLFEEGAPLA
jgi:hypothetical protein